MRWPSWRSPGGHAGRQKRWPMEPMAKLRDQVDASQALAEAMGSIQEAQEANKRTQDTNQAWMLNHSP